LFPSILYALQQRDVSKILRAARGTLVGDEIAEVDLGLSAPLSAPNAIAAT
jgi:hypothetical protein